MSDQSEKSKLMTETEAMRLVWTAARIAFLFGVAMGVLLCIFLLRILV